MKPIRHLTTMRYLFTLATVLVVAGRSVHAQPAPSAEPVAKLDSTAAPQASPADRPSAPAAPSAPTQVLNSAESDYVLTSGDTIELNVFREPELTTRSTIARDGTVQLPLIQEVKLAGLTVRQGRNLIRNLYSSKYLVDPQVYLSVVQFAQRKFTIMGQILKPGSYELQGGQTLDLLEAIGTAGGFTRIADKGKVLIKRKSSGKDVTIKVNVKKMINEGGEPFQVLPGDVITVGESWF